MEVIKMGKKFLANLSVVFLLAVLMVSEAGATKKTFQLENKIGSVTADVPRGWSVQESDGQITFTSPKEESILTVIAGKTEGSPLQEIALQVSKNLGGGTPVRDGNMYTFTFKNKNNAEFYCAISSDERTGLYLCLVMRGDSSKIMEIVESIELADMAAPQNTLASVVDKPAGNTIYVAAAIP
jgi:hypothetical protein